MKMIEENIKIGRMIHLGTNNIQTDAAFPYETLCGLGWSEEMEYTSERAFCPYCIEHLKSWAEFIIESRERVGNF